MNNYVILKWGSLKAYNFTDEFIEHSKDIVEEFVNIWDEIYENSISAVGGSKELQQKEDLKHRLVIVLEKLFELGVVFQNGWSDTYYNNFEEIKDYILNYNS